MTDIHYFDPQPHQSSLPEKFANPYGPVSDRLAHRAVSCLQKRLNSFPMLDNGKMFGVLVVVDSTGRTGYLSGFSGMLNQSWLVPEFVPPIFNPQEQASFLSNGERQLAALSNDIESCLHNPKRLGAIQQLSNLTTKSDYEIWALKQRHSINKTQRRAQREALTDSSLLDEMSRQSQKDKKQFKQLKTSWRQRLEQLSQQIDNDFELKINALKSKRKQLSQHLHHQVFDGYRLRNSLSEVVSVKTLFGGNQPPAGTGDCAAPKLLQYAFQQGLKPLALAEFWWGSPPADGVRHHGEFYPPCRGKCEPILPFMLKGLTVAPAVPPPLDMALIPSIIYEDDQIVLVNKPAGMLSVPGKGQSPSVQHWLDEQYPDANPIFMAHRLDMATSGLLLATKNLQSYKLLQKQFMQRRIEKRYVAILSKPIQSEVNVINLPLRVDLDDRPRQLVCHRYGKKAQTRVEVISVDEMGCRVYFYPITGRTHQLRVHAAHSRGLSAPIKGDALYGTRADRLYLHAEKLSFDHPSTGERMLFEIQVPF